jgi:hypothetical protein
MLVTAMRQFFTLNSGPSYPKDLIESDAFIPLVHQEGATDAPVHYGSSHSFRIASKHQTAIAEMRIGPPRALVTWPAAFCLRKALHSQPKTLPLSSDNHQAA